MISELSVWFPGVRGSHCAQWGFGYSFPERQEYWKYWCPPSYSLQCVCMWKIICHFLADTIFKGEIYHSSTAQHCDLIVCLSLSPALLLKFRNLSLFSYPFLLRITQFWSNKACSLNKISWHEWTLATKGNRDLQCSELHPAGCGCLKEWLYS